VTLNQTEGIAEDKIIDEMVYEHPVYTLDSLASQKDLANFQGTLDTYYCGAYHGWGFHEDGCFSGVRVAEALGAGW
jgi:predicted NAD/FAD-binding protein